jgi:protein phosphatase PTC7
MNKEIGSTTCVILTLDEDEPILRTSYIGDSGYVIYRKERENLVEKYMYEEHTHGFNFPF